MDKLGSTEEEERIPIPSELESAVRSLRSRIEDNRREMLVKNYELSKRITAVKTELPAIAGRVNKIVDSFSNIASELKSGDNRT